MAFLRQPTVLVAGLLALSPSVCLAGANIWTSYGPEGGSVSCLAIDPSQTSILYVGTVYSGIFRSADGGATWSPADNGLTRPDLGSSVTNIQALLIDPSSPHTLYAAAADDGIFARRTQDRRLRPFLRSVWFVVPFRFVPLELGHANASELQ